MVAALRSVLVCVPVLCLSGCSWFPWLVMNVTCEPVDSVESFCFCAEAHDLATKAWHQVEAAHPDTTYSTAYADGFESGFYDYVTRDRTTDPRTFPPFCYRYPILRTPAQQAAIADWYAGFNHGATVAQERGWRDGVVVPISRPPFVGISVFSTQVIPVSSPQAPPPKAPAAAAQPLEEMPVPKLGPPPPILPPPKLETGIGRPIPTEPQISEPDALMGPDLGGASGSDTPLD